MQLNNTPKFYIVGGGNKTPLRQGETRRNLRFLAADDGGLRPTMVGSGQPGQALGLLGTGIIVLEDMSGVTKLEAANRALCTAIRMFFADGDAVAVHMLVCAAGEIYERHCSKADLPRTTDDANDGNPDRSENERWDTLNEPRNLFKHPAKDLTDQILFSDEMNDYLLLVACNDCSTLCAPDPPIEVQVYATWFRAIYTCDEPALAPVDSSPVHYAERIAKLLSEWFPGVRQAPRLEQKRFGSRLMDGVFAGRL